MPDPLPTPIAGLTTAGRILAAVTLRICAVFLYDAFTGALNFFPPRRRPLKWLPFIVLCGAVFFGICAVILRLFGIRVFR